MSIIETLETFRPVRVVEVDDDDVDYSHRVVIKDEREYVVDLGMMDAQETLRNGNYPKRVEQRTEYDDETEMYCATVLFQK